MVGRVGGWGHRGKSNHSLQKAKAENPILNNKQYKSYTYNQKKQTYSRIDPGFRYVGTIYKKHFLKRILIHLRMIKIQDCKSKIFYMCGRKVERGGNQTTPTPPEAGCSKGQTG